MYAKFYFAANFTDLQLQRERHQIFMDALKPLLK